MKLLSDDEISQLRILAEGSSVMMRLLDELMHYRNTLREIGMQYLGNSDDEALMYIDYLRAMAIQALKRVK